MKPEHFALPAKRLLVSHERNLAAVKSERLSSSTYAVRMPVLPRHVVYSWYEMGPSIGPREGEVGKARQGWMLFFAFKGIGCMIFVREGLSCTVGRAVHFVVPGMAWHGGLWATNKLFFCRRCKTAKILFRFMFMGWELGIGWGCLFFRHVLTLSGVVGGD